MNRLKRIAAERHLTGGVGRGVAFDVHPDGERVALVPAAQIHTSKQVTFRFNFFDELRRIAPIGSR